MPSGYKIMNLLQQNSVLVILYKTLATLYKILFLIEIYCKTKLN